MKDYIPACTYFSPKRILLSELNTLPGKHEQTDLFECYRSVGKQFLKNYCQVTLLPNVNLSQSDVIKKRQLKNRAMWININRKYTNTAVKNW